MFGIALLDLPDDDRDRRGVDVGFPHQRRRAPNVVGVDGFEELLDFSNGRELLQNERAFEVRIIHRYCPSEEAEGALDVSVRLQLNHVPAGIAHVGLPVLVFGAGHLGQRAFEESSASSLDTRYFAIPFAPWEYGAGIER